MPVAALAANMTTIASKRITIRDLGYAPGELNTGATNSILDVKGVHVSQITLPTSGEASNNASQPSASKGVTIISPRPLEEYYKPCNASTFTFNGNGEMTCSRQIADWGFTNTPIGFTNSLSLGGVFDGIWDWIIDRQDLDKWDALTRARNYGTPVVGETADWWVNCDVRASRVLAPAIKEALNGLKSAETGGQVFEGQAGGGAGMTCHQFTGGTGTSSRLVGGGEGSKKEYTLGVLCQSNYGHLNDLVIGGIPIGKILAKEKLASSTGKNDEGTDVHASTEIAGRTKDGSILILIITDAPLATHQLNRLARHATVGLTSVGGHGVGRTHSGDIFLALSTAEHGSELIDMKMKRMNPTQTYSTEVVKNESIDAYFVACAEAVEEAILNSLVGGHPGVTGMDGTKIDGLPLDKVKELLSHHLMQV